MQLTGQAAFVTGAGRGIGRAIAVALAQAGADVAINYLDNDAEAEEVAAAVRQAGRRALLLQGDVSEQDVVEDMVGEVVQAFGKIDVAVANAYYSAREPFW